VAQVHSYNLRISELSLLKKLHVVELSRLFVKVSSVGWSIATINVYTKFKVSVFTYYEDMTHRQTHNDGICRAS